MIQSAISALSLSFRAITSGSLLAISLLSLTAAAGSGQAPSPAAAPLHQSAIATVRRWFQVGVASWYGPHFQGRQTANGETFNMHELTCAHRTLPLGTLLRVTNLRNRKSVLVRVNDRGPMVDGRIVDLSYAAAKAVGIDGLGKVRLEKVSAADPAVQENLLAQLNEPALAR